MGSDLKHNNFDKKWLEHVLSMLLLTSARRQVFKNNELVKTKKKLTWWERVNPNETCTRVREVCVWAFSGVRSKVERCYDIIKTF